MGIHFRTVHGVFMNFHVGLGGSGRKALSSNYISMGQNTVIWVVVVLVIVVGGVWFFSSPMTTSENTSTDTSTTATGGQTGTGDATVTKNTFKSIFTQEGDYQCTYEQVSATGRGSNVVDIADGKMRGEFRTTTSDKSINDLMVYDGGYLYTWVEGTTAGKKTQLKSIADLPNAIPQDLTSAAVFGSSSNNVSWDCHRWVKDLSVLAVPTYVKFTAK